MTARSAAAPRLTICCTACGARGMVRSSQQITATVREVRLICSDPECNHSFVAQVAVIRTINPSRKARADAPVLPIGNQNLRHPRTPQAGEHVLENVMTGTG